MVNLGYQIIAISTDSHENLNKSLSKHQLTYTLLSDPDLPVSKQFGIGYKAPMAYDKTITEGSGGENVDKLLPVPSIFILDKTGTIQFEYINRDFRQRISPGLLTAVAVAIMKGNKISVTVKWCMLLSCFILLDNHAGARSKGKLQTAVQFLNKDLNSALALSKQSHSPSSSTPILPGLPLVSY